MSALSLYFMLIPRPEFILDKLNSVSNSKISYNVEYYKHIQISIRHGVIIKLYINLTINFFFLYNISSSHGSPRGHVYKFLTFGPKMRIHKESTWGAYCGRNKREYILLV